MLGTSNFSVEPVQPRGRLVAKLTMPGAELLKASWHTFHAPKFEAFQSLAAARDQTGYQDIDGMNLITEAQLLFTAKWKPSSP